MSVIKPDQLLNNDLSEEEKDGDDEIEGKSVITSPIIKENKTKLICENYQEDSCKHKDYNDQCKFMTLSSNSKRCKINDDFMTCRQPNTKLVTFPDDPHKISCEYDLDMIDDIDMLKEYYFKFGIRDRAADDIFPKLCSFTTTDSCDINSDTKRAYTKCPYAYSNNIYGQMCKEWLSLENSYNTFSPYLEEWCKKNAVSDFALHMKNNKKSEPNRQEIRILNGVNEQVESNNMKEYETIQVYGIIALILITLYLYI